MKRLLILLFVVVSAGCSKKDLLTANVECQVFLRGTGYEYPTPDAVLFTMKKGKKIYSGMSDTTGKIVLEDVPAGTYQLTWSKEGYSDYRDLSYIFYPSGIDVHLGSRTLYGYPQMKIKNETLEIDQSGTFPVLRIFASLSDIKEGHERARFRAYFSRDSLLAWNRYEYTMAFNNFGWDDTTSLEIEYWFYNTTIPYDSGESVFVKVFPLNESLYANNYQNNLYPRYLDENGYYIYYGVNNDAGSEALSFIWPVNSK